MTVAVEPHRTAEQQRCNVFENSATRVRHYPDGGVRIIIGCRASTRAVLTTVRGLS
jgi:hypothetical protein